MLVLTLKPNPHPNLTLNTKPKCSWDMQIIAIWSTGYGRNCLHAYNKTMQN